MLYKYCNKCGQEKPLDEFHKNKKSKDGHHWYCKKCNAANAHKYQKQNKDHYNSEARRRTQDKKKKVFEMLGNKCACCGEIEFTFLQIDHPNNDGVKHRSELGHGDKNRKGAADKFYKEILAGMCKYELQLLCANCHHSKTLLGECIHKQMSPTK